MPHHDPWLRRSELLPSDQHHRYHLSELRRRRAKTGRYRRARARISAALHILADRISP
jgi:hypothetical protein